MSHFFFQICNQFNSKEEHMFVRLTTGMILIQLHLKFFPPTPETNVSLNHALLHVAKSKPFREHLLI